MSNYDDDANRMMDIYDDEEEDGPARPIMDEFGNLLDEDEVVVAVVADAVEWAGDEDEIPAALGIALDDEDGSFIPGELDIEIEEITEIAE